MHTDFGVLMATDKVLDALRAMDEWPREKVRAVIERHQGSKRYYYLYVSDELFTRLQKTQTDTGWEAALGVALELHEHESVAELDAFNPLPADLRGSAVVTKWDRVVGYIIETDLPKIPKGLREDLKKLSSLEQQVVELYQAGKFKEAISIALESLELSEKALGADHPGTARDLNNLARLYYSMGDYDKAEPLCQRALRIDEMALGRDHPATASDLNNLALLYHSLDNYDKAEPLLQRALKIKEKTLGYNHPATATTLNNLAVLYGSRGDYGQAESLVRRALKIREKALGADHPDLLEGISGRRGHRRGGRISLPALWDVASTAASVESETGAKKAKHVKSIHVGNVGGGVKFTALGDIVGGDKITTTTIDKSSIDDKFSQKSMPPSPEPGPVTSDFKAYPRLDVLKDGKPPTTVQSGDVLKVVAGFRVDIDAAVSETGPIEIRDVQQGETCLLHFFLKGLALTTPVQFANPEKPHWELPLEPTATVPEFGVTVLKDATEVECKVEYYARGVLAGIARRKLDLAGARTKAVKANPCRFNLEEVEAVDLTISITHARDGHLEFVFSGPAVGVEPVRSAAKSDLPNSLQLARDLYDTLKAIDFRDTEARDALEGLGQKIQQLLPDDFFHYVNEAQALPKPAGRTVPTILLLTDEAYIPWELTRFEDPAVLFDKDAPPFLGAQTIMGRWIPRDYIRMPPFAVCNIRKFQVFASPYTKASTRQRELLAAVEEQKKLMAEYADWNSEAYEARRSDLNKVKADKTEGKAVHFAVHGLSDPAGNRQQLILEDARIPADTLIGAYTCGQTPRFSFVFMNACQVGIPGEVLGEVAGFPGELVRGGCYGVIAPLWDVHDDVAQECAMAFYKAVFKEGKSVAEALRERRATYASDSTTPVAYVYYGHPSLKLRKA